MRRLLTITVIGLTVLLPGSAVATGRLRPIAVPTAYRAAVTQAKKQVNSQSNITGYSVSRCRHWNRYRVDCAAAYRFVDGGSCQAVISVVRDRTYTDAKSSRARRYTPVPSSPPLATGFCDTHRVHPEFRQRRRLHRSMQ